MKRRTNPRRKGPISKSKPGRVNPRQESPTVIYGLVLRIEAQKTQPHACDADCASRDHKYYHDFKKGSKAMIVGMPAGVDSKDRSLRIVSKSSKRK